MKIGKDTVVTMHYKVVNAQGQLLDKAQEPTSYLHGGYENTLPKIEEALEGQDVGFETTLNLAAADAFGERDETLVQTIAKKDFPPGVKVGGQLRGRTPEGQEHVFTVIKVKGDQVILDGNHPWAGQNLSLSLKVLEVRAASADEVTHRHAHGAHGHHH
ncbi:MULTISPECIES: FKBP-type peptidyl-prolyl cis-trans isomerase [unclassified Limnohabitans]|jgi:FKBP-type peptidyl-prolyl cis-trans isomerase SlyD|uniref:FKBP-type peptidyl-prolyl cis-trans isomerase n=1 Tax=unclassified Limnohabitans TaxID=2626134 RepID=UPI000D398765|nr:MULTISPECIES: peptidylprolyl isomerase [unclassified Limnohabitans]PUE21755.1 peptidylprolyl isomerase [Limnohabitans sp. MMS-10A-192]PUE26877.1 peptidylprolyl isomerase [Limnohabitans sp. MMS-10A-160]